MTHEELGAKLRVLILQHAHSQDELISSDFAGKLARSAIIHCLPAWVEDFTHGDLELCERYAVNQWFS